MNEVEQALALAAQRAAQAVGDDRLFAYKLLALVRLAKAATLAEIDEATVNLSYRL